MTPGCIIALGRSHHRPQIRFLQLFLQTSFLEQIGRISFTKMNPPGIPTKILFHGSKCVSFTHPNFVCQQRSNITNNITQNWRLDYCGLIFFGLDWNSRQHAASMLGYKGAWPGADLHDYSGGTFAFLREQLATIENDTRPVVLMQHHPFRAPLLVPDFIYGFSGKQKEAVRNLLSTYLPVERYWGVLAGHWHRWFDGTAFDEWPSFRQWETEACKAGGAISLVRVNEGRIVNIQRLYGPK